MKRTNTAICYQSTLPGWQKQRYLDMAYLKHWRKVQSTACSIALQSRAITKSIYTFSCLYLEELREESDIDSDDDCVIHDIETYSDVDILVTGFSLDSEKPSVKEKLVEWATKNQLTRSSLNELSEILRDEDIPLPKDARTLLQTPRAVAIENKCGGKYAYFESKPSSIEGYLHDFIEEFTNIEKDEILMNNVTLKTFVCDAPARSFLKCTKGHTGYYACEVKGSYTSSRVVLHETGDFLPRTEKSSNVRIQQPSHDPGPSPVPGSHDPGPSPVPGSHDPGPSPVPGIHDPGPRLGRNPGPAPRLGRNPGSCRLQRLGPRLGTNSGPGLSLGPGLQDLRKAAPGRCPGINPGPGLSLGPGLQDPRKAALGRGPGINPGPDPDLSLGPGLQDLRMAAPERGSRINPGPGLQDPRELIGIEYLYRQTGHTLEDMMEEQDEEEGFVLEDENENLDEGFEEIDLTLPTPVMATRPDVLTFGSETYTSDSETSTPEKPKRRGFLKPEARLLLAINENEEFISHSLSSLNSSPPVMPVYVTPSVSEIESDNVEGCFVGQNRGPAQYPDQNRYVEAVMVKLCARHLRNIPQNKVLFQRWSLVMNDYKSIREKVNSNDRVMKSTSLQIFNVNVRTISAWSSKREKMQEKAIIGQALILPKPLRTASNPLPAAISVQKSPPRVEQEQQHHFELPENTAGLAKSRQNMASHVPHSSSGRPLFVILRNRPVERPKPLVPVPRSTLYYRRKKGTNSTWAYVRKSAFKICIKCCEPLSKETGHQTYYGAVFCPKTTTMPLNKWTAQHRTIREQRQAVYTPKRKNMRGTAILGQGLNLPKPPRIRGLISTFLWLMENALGYCGYMVESIRRESRSQSPFSVNKFCFRDYVTSFPEGREVVQAKKLRREKKLAEDLAKAASKRSSTMCASNGVVSSPIQKPWSPDTLKRRLEHNLSTVLGYGTHPQSDDCRVIEIPWDILLIAWQGTKYSTPHVPVCKQTAGYYVEAVGVGMADTVAAALKKHKDLHLPKNADLESDDELDDCEKSKEFHGAFYELHAISVRLLREEKNFPQLDTVSNGLVLELRSFYDKSAKSKTLNSIYNVLCEINSAFCMSNSQAVLTKLSHVLEQKKKLVSKKKVAGVKNIKDFLLKEFEQLETTTKSKTNTTELLAPLQNSASITLDDTINQIKNSFRLDDDSNRNLSSSLSTQTHRIKSSVGSRC
ncbi:hypothetical protein GQR58_016655 [Nymphon striatum]|nr:hypothetical protein GQR58_016655 [Nymphon striatum]